MEKLSERDKVSAVVLENPLNTLSVNWAVSLNALDVERAGLSVKVTKPLLVEPSNSY